MDWLRHWFALDGRFLGVDWHFWKMVGWTGNLVFFSRFIVQWWATEKNKRVVVPDSFWWLSLLGSFCLLAYGIHQRDSVFIFAYLFTWVPYIRNLIISHRVAGKRRACLSCQTVCPPGSSYCCACGVRLDSAPGALKANP